MRKDMRRSFKYFTTAGFLLALTMFSACGSSNTNSSNGANSAVKNTNSVNSGETTKKNSSETEANNSTPVVLTTDSLFTTGDYSNYTGIVELEKKYKDRVLLISDLYLWEITDSEITASDRILSGGNFIKCEGDFAKYADSASRVKELRDRGNAVKGTIRGTFKEVKETSGQAEITMNPCVLVSLEK
jgi:hypothetical protein